MKWSPAQGRGPAPTDSENASLILALAASGAGNRRSEGAASTVMDPYELAFRSAADNGVSIGSEREWAAFCARLQEEALVVSEVELGAIEDLWIAAQAEAKAHQRSSAPSVSLEHFQKHVVRLHHGAGMVLETLDGTVVACIAEAGDQYVNLQDVLREWDLSQFDEGETHQLMASLDAFETNREELMKRCETLEAFENAMLECERMTALLRATRTGVCATELSSAPSSSAILWQRDNASFVEKALARSRYRAGSFRVLRASGGGYRLCASDTFGLCGGYRGRFGLQLARAEVQSRIGEATPAFAVVAHGAGDGAAMADGLSQPAVSGISKIRLATCKRRGVLIEPEKRQETEVVLPVSARAALLRQMRALRELSCSKYFVQYLGSDTVNASGDLVMLYEFAPARTLDQLLRDTVLPEASAIFRHWASEIARALKELHQMCTHVISAPRIGLKHVLVAGQGTSVRLGGFDFGDSVADLGASSSACITEGAGASPCVASTRALAGRERRLVGDLGELLRAMLGIDAAWRETDARWVDERDKQTVRVHPGNTVIVRLSPSCAAGGRWLRPERLSTNAVFEVLTGDSESPFLPNDGDGSALQVRALCTGTAQLLVHPASTEGASTPGGTAVDAEDTAPVIITVDVLDAPISPQLAAILRTCDMVASTAAASTHGGVQKALGRYVQKTADITYADELAPMSMVAAPQISLVQLQQHPYFSATPSTDMDGVMASFKSIVGRLHAESVVAEV